MEDLPKSIQYYQAMNLEEVDELSTAEIHAIPLDVKRDILDRFNLNPDVKPSQVRRAALILMGKKKPRRQYETREARSQAAKARGQTRKTEGLTLLEELGLAPRPKVKMSKEDSAAKRKEKRQGRREKLSGLAKEHPDLFQAQGLDPRDFIMKDLGDFTNLP